MLERFKRDKSPTGGAQGATATDTRHHHDAEGRDERYVREDTARAEAPPRATEQGEPAPEDHATRTHHAPADERESRALQPHAERDPHTGGGLGALDKSTMAAARARQREEYGGISWGAAIFGWLAASGLAAILAGLVSAAGATLAIGDGQDQAAQTIGVAGAIALLVVLVVSYFAGGYVAGRMARFDGARQGLGVWLVALVVAVVLAAAGAVLGGEYNVLQRLNLPRIPVDEGALAAGGLIALAVAVLGSLLAAMAGGKAGERFHKKVDRVAVDAR